MIFGRHWDAALPEAFERRLLIEERIMLGVHVKKIERARMFREITLNVPKETPQQAKMKSCNADAKGMKGDARKKFMSECLKK